VQYTVLVAGGYLPPPPERITKKRKVKRGEFLTIIIMKKILDFAENISGIYAVIYVAILHIVAIGAIGASELDFTKPMADIVLGYLGILLLFAIFDLCFLIPSIGLIAFGTLISFVMAISIPLFLFLALFQMFGAESVDVLEFGFIKTLLACIIATPIGLMNLKSLKTLGF
jgi:hypothetical protein